MPMMRRRNPPTGFEVTRLRVESRHQMLKWDDRSYLNEPAAASGPLHTASGGPLAAAECTRVRYEVGTKESHLGNCLVFSSVEPLVYSTLQWQLARRESHARCDLTFREQITSLPLRRRSAADVTAVDLTRLTITLSTNDVVDRIHSHFQDAVGLASP